MKKGVFIFSVLLLQAHLLFAAGVQFTATVSKNEVYTNEQFEVDFTINGNGDRFTAPSFNGFEVLSGPNLSQSMTSVNGNTSFSTAYSYILVATNAGSYTIDAAAIVANGHTLTTGPIRIKVIKGQAPQAAQQAQGYQPGQQQPQAAPDNNAVGNTRDISKNLFIRADVDKTRVYQGEQVTVSYKLYTRVSLVGDQMDKAPDLNGFWSQDINPNRQSVQWNIEEYKGIRYNVAVIKQTVVFPEHSGDLTVDPLAMTFVVRQQSPSTDIFDQFFGSYKDVKYQVKSAPVIVHVNPLPEAGKPANFDGAVGKFTIDAAADKKELKANETLNYTFKISGSGNLNLLNAPNINPPADFDKYDPKVTDNISVATAGVSGTRQYSYLLIPRHQGSYTINPASFSYFNPATRRYVVLPVTPSVIKVDKGDATANVTAFNTTDQQNIKLLGKDIRYIKTTQVDLYKDGEGFYGSAAYYLLLLLGPVSFASAFAYRRWYIKNNSDIVKVKSRKASKIAAKHLANAKAQLATNNKNLFYEAVAKGLYGYLSDKLNIPAADLNRENIVEKLQARSLDDGAIKQVTDTMDLCEMARFSLISGISEQNVFDKAKNAINEIEDKI